MKARVQESTRLIAGAFALDSSITIATRCNPQSYAEDTLLPVVSLFHMDEHSYFLR